MRLIGFAFVLVASLILTALAEAQPGGAGLQGHGTSKAAPSRSNAARQRVTPSACKTSPPSWFDSVST
jgi:hypothetical protein